MIYNEINCEIIKMVNNFENKDEAVKFIYEHVQDNDEEDENELSNDELLRKRA